MTDLHAPAIFMRPQGRTLVFDSATHVEAHVAAQPCAGDVVVASSYVGVLCARMIMVAAPRAVIGLDCAIGKDGAGIAGLAAVDPDGIAGASVSALSARMGDGQSTYFDGIISACNRVAAAKGVKPGQTARAAAQRLLD